VSSPAEAGTSSSGLWALPLLALGLCLVACAVLIPAAEENRLVEAERRRLVAEVESLRKKAEMNEQFLTRLHHDQRLVERLRRRLRPPGPDENVAILASHGGASRWALSPLAMLEPAPVEAEPPPAIVTGVLADWCRDDRQRLIVLGVGLMAVLVALLAGGSRTSPDTVSA